MPVQERRTRVNAVLVLRMIPPTLSSGSPFSFAMTSSRNIPAECPGKEHRRRVCEIFRADGDMQSPGNGKNIRVEFLRGPQNLHAIIEFGCNQRDPDNIRIIFLKIVIRPGLQSGASG